MLKSSSWKQKLDVNSIVQEQEDVMNVEIERMEVIQKCIWCGYLFHILLWKNHQQTNMLYKTQNKI